MRRLRKRDRSSGCRKGSDYLEGVPARQVALKCVLADKMKEDSNFAKEVEKLVREAQKESTGAAFDQRGQTVHGPQTNIAGNVHGPVFSGQFSGPVAQGGDANDFRGSIGAIYRPSSSVSQHFGDNIEIRGDGNVIGDHSRSTVIKQSAPSGREAKAPEVDFLLVTPLPEERDAVLKKLKGYKKVPPIKDDIHTYTPLLNPF